MHTEPKIIMREAQPYVAMRRHVLLPFDDDTIDAILPRLWDWLAAHAVEPAGPAFLKYDLVDPQHGVDIEFGAPTAALLVPDAETVVGTLPAGRYASLTYHGHYRNLMPVTAELLHWMAARGESLDAQATPQGDRFAARLEIYTNDPREVLEPENWETVLAFKLRALTRTSAVEAPCARPQPCCRSMA